MLESMSKEAAWPSGRVVKASDLKSGDPEFGSRSDHQLDLFEVIPSSVPRLRLLHSQLVCLLPVEIPNPLSLFQLFVSLALQSHNGEWSVKHVCMFVRNTLMWH